MKRLVTFVYLAFLHSSLSTAAVTINMVENGGNVVAMSSGTINTAGLTPTDRGSTVYYEGYFRGGLNFVQPGVIGPLDGNIAVGNGGGSVDEYIIETTHLFSTGVGWGAQSNSGNHVGIISRSDMGDSITVPSGYSSGDPISGTSTWPGATLDAMRAIPGTYVFTWGSGSTADSLTLNIGSAPSPTYTVSGTLSGKGDGSITLQNSGGDNLVRNANGSFTFATALPDDSAYAVTVLAQPAGQTCTVNNGDGTIASANVSNVNVSCLDIATPVRSYSDPLPSLTIGTLSFTSSDPGCTFDGSQQFLPESSITPAPPENVSSIDGFVQFTIIGCAVGATVNVSMDYNAPLPDGAVFWKASNPWYPIVDALIGVTTVQFSITDGGFGDEDGIANGQIVDPSGAVLVSGPAIAVSPGSATAVPTMSGWALILLSMLLGLFVFLRREQLV